LAPTAGSVCWPCVPISKPELVGGQPEGKPAKRVLWQMIVKVHGLDPSWVSFPWKLPVHA
jgi:hypothetical protein